jgi:thiamine pyrophosphokinase
VEGRRATGGVLLLGARRDHYPGKLRLMRTVVVLAGGPDPPPRVSLPAGVTVIAADSGAELGSRIDFAVGDFDSISVETLVGVERVERHPAAKDASDLELALEAALRFEPGRIVVFGGAGGRLDHLLGGLLLLAADAYAEVEVDAQFGGAAVHVVRGERLLAGELGELVSLFAVHGPASGVVTEGLMYPLRGERLEPGSTRGLSNVFAASEARVRVERGVVLAVRPSGSVTVGS